MRRNKMKKYNCVVSCTVDEVTHKMILKNAEALDLNVSQYIRDLILKKLRVKK